MIDTNPVRGTVYKQLQGLLGDLDKALNELVPRLIDDSKRFFDYDQYRIEQDEWMDEIAFPRFHEIFAKHEVCSVDIVFFDLDLEDFRHTLAFVRKQEGLYIDEMDAVIDGFTELSDRVDSFYDKVDEFDRELFRGV